MAEEEKKRLSPLTLAAGAGASILSMVIGSFFKTAGTIAGAAIASITYSVGAFWFEDKARRAHARVTARRRQGKPPGSYERLADLPLERTLILAEASRSIHRDWGTGKRLSVSAGILAFCLTSAIITLFAIEGVTGKTLSSNLGNGTQYGTTLGGYSSHKPSPLPVTPTVLPSQTASPVVSTGSAIPSGVSPDTSPAPSATYTGISSGQLCHPRPVSQPG
jgi:hypothetical protein